MVNQALPEPREHMANALATFINRLASCSVTRRTPIIDRSGRYDQGRRPYTLQPVLLSRVAVMLIRFFNLLSRCPLWLLQLGGSALGVGIWLGSPRHRRQLRENAGRVGLSRYQRWLAILHTGRMVAELPRLWLGEPMPFEWSGVDLLHAAVQRQDRICLLTPHMGCFEMCAQGYAQTFAHPALGDAAKPITVLYRPSRQATLQQLVHRGRERSGMFAAPATLSGVKQLIKALKSAQTVGLLPDQVPPDGMGVWAPFLGQPAYTMTLAGRLAREADTVLMMWGERLPWGRGFRLHVAKPVGVLPADPEGAAAMVNAWVEQTIQACPEQYLWGYDRFKGPRRP